VTVNCSAVVETLFENELFGHQRGAFTGATDTKVGLFEHADKGTLFLDEIGELPLTIQAKLLRAVDQGEVQRVGSLEGKHVDVAVIAATNRDLRTEAANGRFRSDLYYRLSVMQIHIVPLRERREDIPYLSAVFIREAADRLNRPMTGMTAAAERTLLQAPWPGNVRELRNVIERACLLSDGKMLNERDVLAAMPPAIATEAPPVLTESALPARGSTLDPNVVTNAQRAQVEHALREARGNKAAAARLLGISRRFNVSVAEALESLPSNRSNRGLTGRGETEAMQRGRRAPRWSVPRGAEACHMRRTEACHTRHARGFTCPVEATTDRHHIRECLSVCRTSGRFALPTAALPPGWFPPCFHGSHIATRFSGTHGGAE
jgi:transcriptional regulator of aromatic amino acid metabolism